MDRFEHPDCPPDTEAREDMSFALCQQRKLAERLALKDELVEVFYKIGYSLRGERFLRDRDETEYEFIRDGEIIKVTHSSLRAGSSSSRLSNFERK